MALSGGHGISIFWRILSAFMLVNVLTSILLIYLAFNFHRGSIHKRTEENIAQQIQIIHDKFDGEFRVDLDRSLRSLAASSALDEYLLGSDLEKKVLQRKLERIFLQVFKNYGTYRSASFADAGGTLIVDVAGEKRRRTAVSLRSNEAPDSGLVQTAEMAARGRLFQHLESIPILLSSGYMEWFMPPREIEIDGPFVGSDGQVSVLAGITKVDLDTGAFGGVVMIGLTLEQFFADLRDVTFFDENPIWVFGPEGEILQQPSDGNISFDPRSQFQDGFQGALQIVSLDMGIIAYQDFAITPGKPFIRVAVALPGSLLVKDFDPAIRFFTIALVISLLVVLAVALYVSRYLSKPIEGLATAASQLAGGDLKARVDVQTTGEVHALVESFNRMAEQLRETIAARDESLGKLQQQAEEITVARIAAEEANEAKSEFLARMSHEIRTPMNGVLGMTDMLGRTSLNARQRRLVDVVRHSAETLLNIINDILDFSRVEAGLIELDPIGFSIRDNVGDVVELLAESAGEKDLEMAYLVEEDVPDWLMGDPHRLRQVLMNLAGNAIKFTETGEVFVAVTKERETEDAFILRFTIKDTGVGIAPDIQDTLFDPFKQADGSINRRFGGTGLGLSIAKQLVALMGGDINMSSWPGEGSVFWFTVPLAKTQDDAVRQTTTKRDLTGTRILVVDDNATNRDIICHYLRHWNADIGESGEGMAAMEMLRDAARQGQPYHLAILDVVMPNWDGVTLARGIRNDPAIAETRLILMSPIGLEAGHGSVGNPSVGAILTKPVRRAELYNQIVTQLRREPDASGDVLSTETEHPADATAVRFDATVLVAEDNPVNQEVAREYLATLGCEVAIVSDGVEAVAAYKDRTYDLVLMDCEMPRMDGLEATRLIREMERTAGDDVHIPIVALTAHALEGQRAQCLAAGMDDHLGKPFDERTLVSALRPYLQVADGPSPCRPQMPAETTSSTGGNVMPDGSGPLDETALNNLRSIGDGRVLQKIARIYLENTPGEMEKLQAAVSGGDGNEVMEIAHSLKSSSANIGALALADGFKTLEQTGRTGAMTDAAHQFGDIELEMKLVLDALSAIVADNDRVTEKA